MANRTNIWNINHNTIKECVICGQKFKIKWSHADRRKCCSRICKDRLQKVLILGNKNPNWKGKGRFTDERGYIKVKVGNQYEYEHILIWKKNKGNIPENYVIHHKDHDKGNNRIENLELLSNSDHMKLHAKERREHV